MNINKAYPSRYLSAADIEDENLILTIRGIQMEGVGQDKEQKPVLYFHETEKGLVLNKTNSNTITQLLGSSETDDWQEKKIAIYAAEVEFQGKMVESIRVRLRAPKAATPAPIPTPQRGVGQSVTADDVPFAFLLALFASAYFVLSATTSILS